MYCIFCIQGQNLLNQSGSDVEEVRSKVENFFDGNFNQTWNTTMNQLDTFVANLSLYISCFEFNKFVGVDSEFEMEQLGIQLVDRKQLWAALVFNDFPANQKTDDLPPYIQYKIRMDADSVDSTRYVEDRIPRPIPRRRPPIDLKYLYFGFSFLQVQYIKIHYQTLSCIICKCICNFGWMYFLYFVEA